MSALSKLSLNSENANLQLVPGSLGLDVMHLIWIQMFVHAKLFKLYFIELVLYKEHSIFAWILFFFQSIGRCPHTFGVIYLCFIAVARGVVIARVISGSFLTSLEMAGLSISIMKVDEELLRLFGEVK